MNGADLIHLHLIKTFWSLLSRIDRSLLQHPMVKLHLPVFLKQRPLPFLLVGSLPLVALIAIAARHASSPLQAVARLNQIPALSQLILKSIAPAPAPSPSPTPTPTPAATPKSASPKPVQPHNFTPEERAINEKVKQDLLATSALVDSVIEMKIAIAQGVPALSLSTTTAAQLTDQKGQSLRSIAANTVYEVQPSGDGIIFNGESFPSIVWVSLPPDGLFRLGDRTYHGQLLLVADSARLWAVNYVNLRQYLHSVVASEVSPSWDMAALKAQAVAARSYALTYYFKPVSSLFQMGADEYYQVYSGIDREAESTSRAVDATSGEFVSARGGIVESLYAASDDIVMEAFQGRGMSQLGALNLAEQGYSYEQILSHYYPGTGIGKIAMDQE